MWFLTGTGKLNLNPNLNRIRKRKWQPQLTSYMGGVFSVGTWLVSHDILYRVVEEWRPVLLLILRRVDHIYIIVGNEPINHIALQEASLAE
jgi:hypothetical protein